jgi:hypothetical protein
MIKLKDLLLENEATHPFIPHKIEGRLEKMIQSYRNNGSKGDLDLSNMKLTKFPDVLKYVEVGGNFDCRKNQLTSLEGAPTSVGGDFDCRKNQLTSLVGAPKSVGGDFYCSDTQLKSLEGAPESVGGNFTCSHNQLTSLEGAPKSIGENKYFWCTFNQLKSLVGAPENVGGDFNCSDNQLTSLEGAPTSVDGIFYCHSNPVKFTEEQIRSVCDVKGIIMV